MCGRYTLRARGQTKFYGIPLSELPLPDLSLLGPRYNIAPSQDVPAIVERPNRGGEPEIASFQWGLVPSWSKEARGFINARAETLEKKASFAESFRQRRCLLPADGFYEWKRSGPRKQPYFFQMKDESQFAFAGIWDRWQGVDRSITSCAIVTTTPNDLLAEIHDRMPVILAADAQAAWLRSDADPRELKALLAPYPADEMKCFPVSSRVNSARVDEPQLVEPVDLPPPMTTGWLF